MTKIDFNSKLVFPVIHVTDFKQAERNVNIVREAGGQGFFLINHEINSSALLKIADKIGAINPDLWLGVNCLGLTPQETFSSISDRVKGVWDDNAGIDEYEEIQLIADEIIATKKALIPDCLYFGGFAFKYQRKVINLEFAAKIAENYMDVVTTSGDGTGQAADVEKLARIKSAIPNKKIAVASGITPENVVQYLPYVDYFLVATGISQSFNELDFKLTEKLISTVKNAVR